MNLCKFKPMCCSVQGSTVFQQNGDLIKRWEIHVRVDVFTVRPRQLSVAAVTLDTCVRAQSHSRVLLFATPWTVAHQAPLSMAFSGKNTGVGCHFLLQGIFLTQSLNPCLLYLLNRQVDSLPLSHLGILCAI